MPMIAERVDLARRGANHAVVCRLPSGWVVLGDVQFLVETFTLPGLAGRNTDARWYRVTFERSAPPSPD